MSVNPSTKSILDACCGSRMFWIDKGNREVIFMDNRRIETTLCDGRTLSINPDVMGDFRYMPFENDSFNLVVFDPPHLVKAGKRSWLALKYGVLNQRWQDDLRQGFDEIFRVLKPNGLLIFKWSEIQIPIADVLKLTPIRLKPLIREQKSKRHWVIFIKQGIREDNLGGR